jgi:hypothetical protein
MTQDSKAPFCFSKFPWHVKEFLQKLWTIWAGGLKKVRHPCPRAFKRCKYSRAPSDEASSPWSGGVYIKIASERRLIYFNTQHNHKIPPVFATLTV